MKNSMLFKNTLDMLLSLVILYKYISHQAYWQYKNCIYLNTFIEHIQWFNIKCKLNPLRILSINYD